MIIDAHIHCESEHPDLKAYLSRKGIKLLNVCVAKDVEGRWREERAVPYQNLAREDPDHFAWCTALELPGKDTDGYVERAISALDTDMSDGSVGCKIWKNIGMELRKEDGSFLMLDDPLFTPLFDHLQKSEIPLLLHTAEPVACWEPLDEDNPHYSYYVEHPEWHLYGKPGYPSHGDIIRARDRVLASHPTLTVVGAHLGSQERDLSALSMLFDEYPRFAIDISARLGDLMALPSDEVRDFFTTYPDRILYGTDQLLNSSFDRSNATARSQAIAGLEKVHDAYYRYLTEDGTVRYRMMEAPGLGLSGDVMKPVMETNAQKYYIGIDGNS